MRIRVANRPLVILLALAVLCPAIWAESTVVDVYNVPVDRLVANLEALIAKDPKNVEWRVNLARVHVMAFALKSTKILVARGRETDGPATVWLRENQPERKR